jgi:4-amino-4-deoxy-L-arabinose transferase-like glycosyltransferase
MELRGKNATATEADASAKSSFATAPVKSTQSMTQTISQEQVIEPSAVDSRHAPEKHNKKQVAFLATFLLVFAAACLLIFFKLGAFPLFNPDEALYAEPAREMRETGEYITTYLNYAVRFTKPPLVIWAMAAAYQLFGVTEFAARYFGASCGAILVAVTYLFTRAQINNRAALISAFALLTAPLFLGVSREAITDIPLSLFVTGSMMCLFSSYEQNKSRKNQQGHENSTTSSQHRSEEETRGIATSSNLGDRGELGELGHRGVLGDRGELGDLGHRGVLGDPGELEALGDFGHRGDQGRNTETSATGSYFMLFLAYTAIGLAVMTKGPIGIILPVAILGIYHLLKWDVRSALLFYKPWFGLPLVALIAIPWFAVEISVTKGAYYREFILRENFQRFTGVVDHKAAWWYHIAAMFGGFFPWTVFLPGAFLASLRAAQAPDSRQSVLLNLLTRFKKLTTRQSTMLFATCGSLLILAFFSAGVSKLIPYTLPAFPLLAVLVGGYIDELWTASRSKTGAVLLTVLAIVYAGALATLPVVGAKLHDCPATLLSAATNILIVHAVAASIAAVLWLKQKFAASLTTFVLATYIALLTIGNQGMEAVSNQWETPIQSFAQFAGASKATIIVYQMRKPSVTFYAGRRFLLPKSSRELAYILSKTDRAYIISRSRGEADLKAQPGTKRLCQMGQYVLTSYATPGALKAQGGSADNAHLDDREFTSSDD